MFSHLTPSELSSLHPVQLFRVRVLTCSCVFFRAVEQHHHIVVAQAGVYDMDDLVREMDKLSLQSFPQRDPKRKQQVHSLALARGAEDPLKVSVAVLRDADVFLADVPYPQPDYSHFIRKLKRDVKAGAATPGAVLDNGLCFNHLYRARASEEVAAASIQRVFRGWRQRVYERVNALRADINRRRDRAVRKAMQQAHREVMGQVRQRVLVRTPNPPGLRRDDDFCFCFAGNWQRQRPCTAQVPRANQTEDDGHEANKAASAGHADPGGRSTLDCASEQEVRHHD